MSSVYWSPGMKWTDVEKLTIEAALSFHGGNRQTTADSLGYSLRTLQDRIKDYGLRGVRFGDSSDDVKLPLPNSNKKLKVVQCRVPLSVTSVPFGFLFPFDEQVKKNHAGKTLEKLDEDGGLTAVEIYKICHKIEPKLKKGKDDKPEIGEGEAVQWLEKQQKNGYEAIKAD